MFYRGSQEVIGASKMDEKLLDEIRRQEARANEVDHEEDVAPPNEETVSAAVPVVSEEAKPSGQQTLMGFGSDA